MIEALERGIRHGSLHLTDHRGDEHTFGGLSSKRLYADIHVKNDDFWLRVFCGHDLGCSCYVWHNRLDRC